MFVDNELQFGLGLAVEAKVIADINATSGIQAQAYSASVLQTVGKSLTKLEVAGLEPGAIVLNPVDFEGIELALASTNAIEHTSLPYDAATRRLYSVPIATTISEAAGREPLIPVVKKKRSRTNSSVSARSATCRRAVRSRAFETRLRPVPCR